MSDNPVVDFASAPVAAYGLPTAQGGTGHSLATQKSLVAPPQVDVHGLYEGSEGIPTDDELLTLRKIAAPIP